MARFTKPSKGRVYRTFRIRLQSDDRYDIFESAKDEQEDRPLAENFQTIALAMEWIDSKEFTMENLDKIFGLR